MASIAVFQRSGLGCSKRSVALLLRFLFFCIYSSYLAVEKEVFFKSSYLSRTLSSAFVHAPVLFLDTFVIVDWLGSAHGETFPGFLVADNSPRAFISMLYIAASMPKIRLSKKS